MQVTQPSSGALDRIHATSGTNNQNKTSKLGTKQDKYVYYNVIFTIKYGNIV